MRRDGEERVIYPLPAAEKCVNLPQFGSQRLRPAPRFPLEVRMDSNLGPAFSRRIESDGTIVSTCNSCLFAVAGSRQETDVEDAELGHTCNPEALDLWKRLVEEIEQNERKAERVKSASVQFTDRNLKCVDCRAEFVFTAGEQLFFQKKQFRKDPKRCR